VIPIGLLNGCLSTFSVEMPLNVTEIGNYALNECHGLRNVAFPPDAVISDDILNRATDLRQLFRSVADMIRNLKHRFNGLPIHCSVYYQSYHQGALQRLFTSGDELDPRGNQQDCLGMTPLHILACSSVHNLEVYHLIIENYPTNLITEDRWGAVPVLYAFWGGAPHDITKFLLDSYQSLHPNHVFNWTMMVETMGSCDTPIERIENLLHVKQTLFPEQPLNWDYLLNKFAEPSNRTLSGGLFQERMRFLFTCGMSLRVEALPFEAWRDHTMNVIQTAEFKLEENNSHLRIQATIAHFEDKLAKLKEITTILELVLWKLSMNENNSQKEAAQSSIRRQCRTTCGADAVICHVLPYLIAVAGDESAS
jgi:hypothetical protein